MSTNKAKLEALLKLINSAAQEAIAEYEKAGGDVPSIDSTVLRILVFHIQFLFLIPDSRAVYDLIFTLFILLITR